MRARVGMRALAVVATSALVAGVTALPIGGQASDGSEVESVSGDAFGLFVDIFVDLEDEEGDEPLEVVVGPEPLVSLPPQGGGPFIEALAALVVDDGEEETVLAGPLEVSTEGALGTDGFAESTARVEDVSPEGFEVLPFVADLVEVECRADAGGPTGSTTVLGGFAEDLDDNPVPVPESPEPDTVVIDEFAEIPDDEGVFEASLVVVANEQTVGPSAITVTGVSMVLFAEFIPDDESEPAVVVDLTLAVGQASCGIDEAVADVPVPVPADPTFTG